jgi:hypothetical protein
MSRKSPQQEVREELSLSEAAANLIEECRMLLPGIQALFGFQLIAVFNSLFAEKLTPLEQRLHLLAIGFVGITIVIIMTPAAYHRQTRPMEITHRFIHISTRLMLFSMAPLAISICLELYLISRLILHDTLFSLLITLGLLTLFILLWFVLPHSEVLKQALGGKR